MKRKMLLLTLALPVIMSHNAQAQTSSRLVAQAHWVNNGATFSPVDSSYYTYTGNRGGDLKHTLKYDNGNTWTFLGDTAYSNAWQYLQTFDAHNNITGIVAQYWSGISWVASSNDLFFYDASNNVDTMIAQSWGGTSWVPVSRDVYSYVGSNLVSDQYQTWNSLTTSFVASSQKNYYYDPVSGKKINETDIIFVSSSPVNQTEYNYTYTGAGGLATTTFLNWDGANWVPATKTTNTYDSTGNVANKLMQIYDASTSTWVNSTLHLYGSFTSNHDAQTDILQAWDTTGGGVWNNVMQTTNTYNSFNQLTSSVGESWNIVGVFEFALNDPMYNYYYGTYDASSSNVAVKSVSNTGGNANVYPVPAQNMLHVDLNWDKAQAATIVIYDALGKVVRQWDAPMGTEYRSAVSVNTLSAGTYFIKVNGAQGEIVKQFVIAH